MIERADSASVAVETLETAGDRVRDTAKWLVTTFAAIAAVLVAGSELSTIGSLEPCWPSQLAEKADTTCGRFLVSVGGLTAAILATMIAIGFLIWVMLPGDFLLGQFAKFKPRNPVIKWFRENPGVLPSQYTGEQQPLKKLFDDVETMTLQYLDAKDSVNKLEEKLLAAEGVQSVEQLPEVKQAALKLQEAEALKLYEEVLSLRGLETAALLTARYVRLSKRFRWPVIWVLFICAVLVAVGVTAFAWGANPPMPPTTTIG